MIKRKWKKKHDWPVVGTWPFLERIKRKEENLIRVSLSSRKLKMIVVVSTAVTESPSWA